MCELWTNIVIVWTISIFVLNDFMVTQTLGTDIGYDCKQNSDCHEGNGGKYSECHQLLRVCVCTINAMGDEELYSTDCNDEACSEAGYCSRNCEPKEIRIWGNDEDWYGKISTPFTSSFIPDKLTSVCFDQNRADNSLPNGFVIKKSTIPDAGLGVFSTQFLRRGTVIGPYKGIIETDSDIAKESGYSWTIKPDSVRPETTWVDARDGSYSNWLRYINMPTSAATENLVVLQYLGEMYYAAFKSIRAGTELLVHYGSSYADLLGIDYIRPSYYYAQEDYVGGACYSKEGLNCLYDTNTICVDETCLCKPDSRARNGICLTDETLGGRCYTKDGERCNIDKNAICRRGTCVCMKNATAVNNVCVLDEMFGGLCSGENGDDCELDTHAECVDGICECKYATSVIYGHCTEDETVGGRCKGLTGTKCKNDVNALCIDEICQCEEGSTVIDGKCMQDERLGGKCLGPSGWPCKLEKQAMCWNGVCVCRPWSSEADGSCVQDGTLHGFCTHGVCKRRGVVCDTNLNKCVCESGFEELVRSCIKQ